MGTNYLRSLRIVHLALGAGLAFFMVIALLLNGMNGALAGNDLTSAERAPFLIVLVVITGVIFFVYRMLIPGKLERIRSLESLEKKMIAWRELIVFQGALIEAPAFFAVVLFMLLGTYALLVWPVVAIVLFLKRQPNRERFLTETALSRQETEEFDRMI
jgi:hypothetical protein